jgi:hypothetical protein
VSRTRHLEMQFRTLKSFTLRQEDRLLEQN